MGGLKPLQRYYSSQISSQIKVPAPPRQQSRHGRVPGPGGVDDLRTQRGNVAVSRSTAPVSTWAEKALNQKMWTTGLNQLLNKWVEHGWTNFVETWLKDA